MPQDPSSLDAFNAATERREYEKSRLPPILKRKVEHLEQKAEREKAKAREEQDRTREQDLASERAKQRLEHLTKTYEDLTFDGVRKPPTTEEIERRATHAVDQRNAQTLAAIDLQRDEKIDAVLALNGDADRSASSPTDLLRQDRGAELGGDFYRASGGPERG